MAKKHVLILGGGFGGVYAAMRLEKAMRAGEEIEVTLVNRDNFILFTPMLHEVAASDLNLTDIVCPLRSLLRKVNVFIGEVEGIDLEGKKVVVRHGYDGHTHEVGYDCLLLALGSTTNFFGLPGVKERAVTMKSLGDAIHLRNRVIAHMEEADTECAARDRGPLMTVVVAGGGFAGIETIASVNDFVRESLAYYPHLSEEMVRMVVVHPGKTILPELGEELGVYAQKKLIGRGVEIRGEVKVASADDGGITLTDGTRIETRTLVWTAGVLPHPLVGTLPCECERGRVCVNEYLEVKGWEGVWALGDCAVVPDKRTGKAHPPTAQHALREGTVAAENILTAVRGTGGKRVFDFRTLGLLASIGRRAGVAKILGVKFSGFVAWALWRGIYLSKLPGWDRKVRVAVHWGMDLLFAKDLVQYLTVRGPVVSGEGEVAEKREGAAHRTCPVGGGNGHARAEAVHA